jgi:uncharacterized phiE125 gp8 family phage protein
MKYNLSVTVKPAVEPITVARVKEHLRITTTDQDNWINRHITAARETIENYTGRALVTQTVEIKLDGFPCDEIWIPNPPLQQILSVKYYDQNGDLQTIDSSLYDVDIASEPGRICPIFNTYWPVARPKLNSVIITAIVGYPPDESGSPTDLTANIPEGLKSAMELLIGHWYENRESTIQATLNELPDGVEAFIWQHKIALYN